MMTQRDEELRRSYIFKMKILDYFHGEKGRKARVAICKYRRWNKSWRKCERMRSR